MGHTFLGEDQKHAGTIAIDSILIALRHILTDPRHAGLSL